MNETEIGWVGRYGGKLLAMLRKHDSSRYALVVDFDAFDRYNIA